jgi:asparagine synthase (glutamine-hydrolysing)
MAKTGSRKVKTYTIGFEEEGYNEADYAAQTAAYLGTEHTQMMVGFSDVMEVLEQIPRAFTEPFADSSELPTMLVSKMTRQHVTVALSGDGGDEFFCGYNTYKDAAAGLQILRSKLPLLKGRLRTRTGALCEGLAGKGRSGLSGKYTAAMKKVGRVLSVDTPEELYRRIANADYRTDWLLGRQEKVPTAMSTYPDGYLEGAEPNLMLMDMLQYLPEDILVKVDRSGMFYSLESRIPILDRDVMEFAWSLPQEYKYADGVTKRILKEVLYRYVPREMMERPKKGFSVPLEKWLREGPMHTWARELMSDAASRAEAYIDTGLFEDMFARFEKTGEYGAVLWHVLMLEQWLVNNP